MSEWMSKQAGCQRRAVRGSALDGERAGGQACRLSEGGDSRLIPLQTPNWQFRYSREWGREAGQELPILTPPAIAYAPWPVLDGKRVSRLSEAE